MATPSKTVGTSIIAHALVTHPGTVIGAAQAVATAIQVTLFLDQGFVEAAVNTNPASWLIQVSAQSSGDEDWYTIQEILLSENGTPADENLTATEAIGEDELAMVATTGFAAGEYVYIQDTGTLANSEWGLIQALLTGPVRMHLLDGLTTGKDSSDTAWGQAERNIVTLNLESIARYRVVYMHAGAAGANTHIRATATVEDSFG